MFQTLRNWWKKGFAAQEESPGPKVTKEGIQRVTDTMAEIRSGKFDRAAPTGTDAQCQAATMKPTRLSVNKAVHLPMDGVKREFEIGHDDNGNLQVVREGIVANVDASGNLRPLQAPVIKFTPTEEHSDPIVQLAKERLNDLRPVPVTLDELASDTPVPAARRTGRRRGKRGGVKRNKNKKK